MDAKVFRITLSSFFLCGKKLTPMAIVYQVRCPSVSGTGADWRNLNFHPYHSQTTNTFSTSGSIISHGSYATQLLKMGYSHVYIKFEPLKFDLWVKPEINFRLWKNFNQSFFKKAIKRSFSKITPSAFFLCDKKINLIEVTSQDLILFGKWNACRFVKILRFTLNF